MRDPNRHILSYIKTRCTPSNNPSHTVQPGFNRPSRIIDREDDYRKRRLNRIISPERVDPFALGDKTPDPSVRTYADIMREEAHKREKEETLRVIAKKKQEEAERRAKEQSEAPTRAQQAAAPEPAANGKRRNRWDLSGGTKEDGPAK
jgi:splicing factor 3B subunit 1